MERPLHEPNQQQESPPKGPNTGKKPQKNVRVIVACMPKSGSTYLTTLLASMPGMRRAILVNGFKRREQEICRSTLRDVNLETDILRRLWRHKALVATARPLGFVSQLHVRYSEPTANILAENDIVPLVLVRNIFDIIVSVRDHYRQTAVFMSMGYVNDDMKQWPDERLHEFIADMVVPWYFNFYMCWQECPNKKLVTYEALTSKLAPTLREITAFASIPRPELSIKEAVEKTAQADTRQNKAVSGRGEELEQSVKDKVRRLADYYPHVDFSPMGL